MPILVTEPIAFAQEDLQSCFVRTGGNGRLATAMVSYRIHIERVQFESMSKDHTVAIFLLVCAGVAVWAIVIYNRLVRDRQRVLTAWSDTDVQLKRRYDLIPKLVAAVEQYARYEESTLKTLIELRSRTGQVSNVSDKGTVESLIGGGLRSLIALAETYPELKADRSFLQLQNELTEVENHIQYARRFYNGSVRNLNTRVASFPDLLIARAFRYRPQPFFELDDAAEKTPPELLS